MKKQWILCAIATAISISFCISTACAAQLERLPDSEDYDAVQSQSETIVSEMNALGQIEDTFGVTGQISENDLDWSRAYKYYQDDGTLFDDTDVSIDDLQDKLDYSWVLPVEFGGKEVYVTFGQHEKDGEMTWDFEGFYTDMEWSAEYYEEKLGQDGENAEQIMLVSGAGEMSSELAVLEQPDGALQAEFVSLNSGETTEPTDATEETITVETDSDAASALQEGVLYSFDEAAQLAQQEQTAQPTEDKGLSGGLTTTQEETDTTSGQGLLLVLILVSGIGIFGLGLYRKKVKV